MVTADNASGDIARPTNGRACCRASSIATTGVWEAGSTVSMQSTSVVAPK